MKDKRLISLITSVCLVVAVVVLLASGCAPTAKPTTPTTPTTTAPPTTPAAKEPIKIGALFDYTGPVADLGPKFEAGIKPGFPISTLSEPTSNILSLKQMI